MTQTATPLLAMMEPRYRLSATMLDAFAYYKASFISEQDLICSLERRSLPPSPALQAGKAFHRLMETANAAGRVTPQGTTIDGMTFYSESDVHDIELPATCPGDKVEVKAVDNYTVHPRVQLSGIADVVTSSGIVRDWKTTGRPGSMERYFTAWQWRVYLLLFRRAHTFEYVQIPIRETIPGKWQIREPYILRLHPYPNMQAEVRACLDELVSAIDTWRAHKRVNTDTMKPR